MVRDFSPPSSNSVLLRDVLGGGGVSVDLLLVTPMGWLPREGICTWDSSSGVVV